MASTMPMRRRRRDWEFPQAVTQSARAPVVQAIDQALGHRLCAAKMTPAQIAEAQAMARKCQASNFKQCD